MKERVVGQKFGAALLAAAATQRCCRPVFEHNKVADGSGDNRRTDGPARFNSLPHAATVIKKTKKKKRHKHTDRVEHKQLAMAIGEPRAHTKGWKIASQVCPALVIKEE